MYLTPFNDYINKNYINWKLLSGNYNAINVLQKHIDKIDWFELSANKYAINYFKKNLHEINWVFMSANKNIKDF